VIRHQDECVGFEIWEALGQGVPDLYCEFACVVGDHVAGVDCAEDGFAFVGADGYEIHAGVGIVVVRQAERLAIWVHGGADYAGRDDGGQFVIIRRAGEGENSSDIILREVSGAGFGHAAIGGRSKRRPYEE